MKEFFGAGGILSGVHQNFEFRAEQLELADFVLEQLINRENGIAEAGAGVGKTLAYLIPSIIYSIENNKKIAVSTETRALQKQIIDKDLPMVERAVKEYIDESFTYSLCLGSSNYPCRKRFEMVLARGKFQRGDLASMEDLQARFKEGKTFNRFDVNVKQALWKEIERVPDICSFRKCGYFYKCLYQMARKEWEESNVLVMNHYLFFTNIMSGKTLLPGFDVIIFDEAHSVEDIASSQMGFELSHTGFMEVLEKLYKKRSAGSIINNIMKKNVHDRAADSINKISKDLNNFFQLLRERIAPGRLSMILKEPLYEGKELVEELNALLNLFREAGEHIDDENKFMEFDIQRSRLFLLFQNLVSGVSRERENFVYWLEKKEDELLGDVYLRGQPVDLHDIMQEEVNSSYESCLYLSATLSINNNFSFVEKRLGINRHRNLLLSSPYDYSSQVKLFINKKNVDPGDPVFIEHASRLAADVINLTGGNCLVLFTSYRMMDMVKTVISGLISNTIYIQGQHPVNEVIERYINDEGSVLMGTHSFWQGVDFPGDLLRAVIIMRLPFSVPDDPPIIARTEKLASLGENPFYSYHIPRAVLKLKQGYGRLIRGKQDRGIVALLDPRIVTKSYGKIFLKSLPETRVFFEIKELDKV